MPLSKLWLIIKTSLMLSGLSLAAFLCLTSTLDDMTRRDCARGVIAACEQVGMSTPKPHQ